MVVLASSEPSGNCMIDTAELDGETNLKVRQAVGVTSKLLRSYVEQNKTVIPSRSSTTETDAVSRRRSSSGSASVLNLPRLVCEVECEQPNNNLTRFEGVMRCSEADKPNSAPLVESLSNDNLLLRGCVLRSTSWMCGLVVFAGSESKLMKNASKKRFKKTSVDIFLNRAVLGIFITMAACCFICTMYNLSFERNTGYIFQDFILWPEYLRNMDMTASFVLRGVSQFLSYFILLNTFVPVSLYVSVEIVRLAHSFFIMWDVEMYWEPSNMAADCKNTSLSEELGQIQYIFSDKTGTLTQNVMTLNKCSIDGEKFGDVLVGGTEIDPYEETGQKFQLVDTIHPDKHFAWYDDRLIQRIKGKVPDNSPIRHFMRVMSACNTVVPSIDPDSNELRYQAQSPDESALVTAARAFGWVLNSRDVHSVTIFEPMPTPTQCRLELLQLLDFDQVRKRMSTIVRDPFDGSIILYCKGADSSIIPFAASGQNALITQTENHLQEFASRGLRTLLYAMRRLSEEDYARWNARYSQAVTSMTDRENLVRETYKDIESNFIILGASAIEDKLQQGVPTAIAQLLSTEQLRMWVLTGDKQETAISIGYSCNLLSQDTRLTTITDDDARTANPKYHIRDLLECLGKQMEGAVISQVAGIPVDGTRTADVRANQGLIIVVPSEHRNSGNSNEQNVVIKTVDTWYKKVKKRLTSDDSGGRGLELPTIARCGNETFALSVTGLAMELILADDDGDVPSLCQRFVDVAGRCSTVICCRMTPLQKARVVELFRHDLGATTLAIGDGANDVPMISAANIGVGISGKEGQQAVLASDIAIGQFRFLARLLLIHGRWSYYRMATFVLYFFYKNVTFTICHFFFAFFCGATAQTVYDQVYIGLFNTIYTAVPCIVLGAFDQDLEAKHVMQLPKLYSHRKSGGAVLNAGYLGLTFIDAAVSAAIVFFVQLGVDYKVVSSIGSTGRDVADLRTFSFKLGFTIFVLVTIRCCQATAYWTIWNFLAIVVSFVIYLAVVFGFDPLIFAVFNVHYEYEGSQYAAFASPSTWLSFILALTTCTLLNLGWTLLIQSTYPKIRDTVRIRRCLDDWRRIGRRICRKQPEPTAPSEQPRSYAAFQPAVFGRSSSRRRERPHLSTIIEWKMEQQQQESEAGRAQRRPGQAPLASAIGAPDDDIIVPASVGSVRISTTHFDRSDPLRTSTGYAFSNTDGFGNLLVGQRLGSVAPIYIDYNSSPI